ncbi:hypothetical protein [Pseudonocardia xinjiangensis]|uniref:hypothetical protein n=1 Tax=Pseudonocardia xinjiangensis TaxID=75289 RepID=UPI001B7CF94E|nr:hypothetical protein [Pseudonocardia xinjiangensis]
MYEHAPRGTGQDAHGDHRTAPPIHPRTGNRRTARLLTLQRTAGNDVVPVQRRLRLADRDIGAEGKQAATETWRRVEALPSYRGRTREEQDQMRKQFWKWVFTEFRAHCPRMDPSDRPRAFRAVLQSFTTLAELGIQG